MVTRVKPDEFNRFDEQLKRIQKRFGEPLKFRWYVVEVTPGYEESGYYGKWVPGKSVKVSDYFYDENDLNAWLELHQADEGKHLAVRKEALYRYTVEEWRIA